MGSYTVTLHTLRRQGFYDEAVQERRVKLVTATNDIELPRKTPRVVALRSRVHQFLTNCRPTPQPEPDILRQAEPSLAHPGQ